MTTKSYRTLVLVTAAVLTSCVTVRMAPDAQASYGVYSPINAENWRIMPLAEAKTFVRKALRDWRIDAQAVGLLAISDAKVGTSGLQIIDSATHTLDVPFEDAAIYVSFNGTSKTLLIGDHTFISTEKVSARDARLIADALNVLKLYGTEGAEIKIDEFSDPAFVPVK